MAEINEEEHGYEVLDKVQKSCDKYDDLKQTWLQNKKRKRSR